MQKPVNPLTLFIQEHSKLLTHLKKLNVLSYSIGKKGISKRTLQTIDGVLKILESEVSVHNRLEEKALFPVIEKQVEGPTWILREEHRLMKISFEKLRKVIVRINKLKVASVQAEELTEPIREVVLIFVNHIHKENYMLFPLLNRYFTRDELNKIAKKMF